MLSKVVSSIVFLYVLCAAESIFASENVKVLILNETYNHIPTKNEKIEKVGSMNGDLLLMGTGYSGTIDIWRGEGGLYITNDVPLEEYVKGVVAAEVGQEWDMEALKVQAVVSRTYVVYQKMGSKGALYDVVSSVLSQVYKGKTPDARISYAVSETSGQILTYNGSPIQALFHSTCGGKTENAEEVFGTSYPYLRSVESACDLSPFSSWERKIKIEDIEMALDLRGIKEVTVDSFTSTDRVKRLKIRSKSGVSRISATDLRKTIGWSRLPSTNFTVSRHGEWITFKGKGYGHGVGLCQWGALQMAKDGKNYKDILSFYYPGAVIQSYEHH